MCKFTEENAKKRERPSASVDPVVAGSSPVGLAGKFSEDAATTPYSQGVFFVTRLSPAGPMAPFFSIKACPSQ
jgi:hypothetical protein